MQSFGGRRMSHAEEGLEEGLEGGTGIFETVKRVRQGKTSGTRDSFFCGHYGSISEVDPANVMWESQLQITAETYHKACASPQPIQTISQNHYSSSQPSQAITHDDVEHTAATRSEKSNYFFCYA